ncbi:MAG: tetratricopeptide repeat protein [Desulfovibrio sp.]|uniref:tetratricopeptide repeat protein n=1 Tax=Desulfovibrio sp. 7SRBS1 TaxID=3378064 RepID=UPI003B3F530D
MRRINTALARALVATLLGATLFGLLATVSFPVAAHAKSVDDYLFMGADYNYRGLLEKAATAFGKALEMEPDNEFALNQMGLISAKLGKFDQSAKYYEQVINAAPQNTYARVMRGLLYLHEDKVKPAFEQFREAVRIDPNNASAYYFMGVIYLVEHNMTEAIQYLRKAQTVGSDDPETHYRLGLAFQGLDMTANARLEFNRTLELNPKHTKALTALGWLYHNTGHPDRGLKTWEQVLKINPKDADARLSISKVLNDEAYTAYQNKDNALAGKLWEQTLQYEPSNKAAKYYLKKIK